ncbi:hypothetical protein MMC26_001976 [Xylographa opegraphella]|nr:hypothetical protein [Xylographa opegraphella]
MAAADVLKHQGRSLSDQPRVDGTAAVSESLVLEETEAFPQHTFELKRACSVASTLHPCSSRSASASAKPFFRIQLPPRDFFNIRSNGRPGSQAQEPLKLPQAPSMLDSPTVEEHGSASSMITPLATPTHERPTASSVIPPLATSTHERSAASFTQEIVNDAVVRHGDFPSSKSRSQTSANMDSTILGASATDAENVEILQGGSSGPGDVGTDNRPAISSGGADDGELMATEPWLQEAMRVSAFEFTETSSIRGTIKVVAQTLPAPVSLPRPKPTEPVVVATTAFPSLMDVLQRKLLTSSTQYIQVTHAVPVNFALTSLPNSPPGTPGITNPPEDYFTSRVFSSAVALADRHDTFTPRNNNTELSALLSPSLAVPPASTDFALLERFIPPSSTQEFMDLFTLGSPSVLVDRLVELSPDGGTLLFIYPTKVGAETFKTDYLNPILDPILRSVVTSHCLSLDIGVELGTMASINHLVSFEGLTRKVNMLLRGLSRGTIPTSHARYTLLHANKSTVHLHRKVWTQWYLKQEAPKIRHVTTEYLSRARKQLGNESVNQVMLMRSIVEGVEQRDYVHGGGPSEQGGIEVGVFVIRRSD